MRTRGNLSKLLVLGFWCVAATLCAQPASGQSSLDPDQFVFSTALVLRSDQKDRFRVTWEGQGTGFIVDKRHRYLITCAHVVGDHPIAHVVFPQANYRTPIREFAHYGRYGLLTPARVVARDPWRDLAVLEVATIPHICSELPLATVNPDVGDPIALIGHPGDSKLLWVPRTGSVQQIIQESFRHHPEGPAITVSTVVVEAEGPVRGGNSGAPFVNRKGQVVGIVAKSNANLHDRQTAGVVFTMLAGGGPLGAFPWLANLRPAHEPGHIVFGSSAREIQDVLWVAYQNGVNSDRILNPDKPMDYARRGDYYLRYGNRPEYAVAAYTEYLRHQPKDAGVYRDRGMAYHKLRDQDHAIADCTVAIGLTPGDAQAFWWRGQAYAAKGDTKQARADEEVALKLDPSLKQSRDRQ